MEQYKKASRILLFMVLCMVSIVVGLILWGVFSQ